MLPIKSHILNKYNKKDKICFNESSNHLLSKVFKPSNNETNPFKIYKQEIYNNLNNSLTKSLSQISNKYSKIFSEKIIIEDLNVKNNDYFEYKYNKMFNTKNHKTKLKSLRNNSVNNLDKLGISLFNIKIKN